MIPAILVSLMVGVNTAFAAEDSFQDFLQTWGRLLSLLGSLINVILWVVIKFIGDLLNNDFIFGAGIEDMLLSIWQTVRNFVNVAFVFVLLVIAFYNIVSIDPEKIPLKKSLGKVAIALILVNFSYFGAKVILDVANVLTTAVFAIPRDIITDAQLSSAENEYGPDAIHAQCYKKFYQGDTSVSFEHLQSDPDLIRPAEGSSPYHKDASGHYLLLPTNCHIPNLVKVKLFKEGDELQAGADLREAKYDELKVVLYYRSDPTADPIDIEAELAKVKTGEQTVEDFNELLRGAELTAKKFGRDSITMILAKTMFDLNKLTEVSAAASTGFLGLTISGIVNLLLLLLYGVMFVAMFVVLLFRVVYLWVCIAFSPLVALMFVFKDFGLELGEFDIQKVFIQYAFVPVKMGIALSVGVLMLFKANQQSLMSDQLEQYDSGMADIQIPIDSIISNDASLQKLMWNIATVAVIWIAIKWSMKDLSGPVNSITDKIFGYVEGLGSILQRTPLVLPIAPFVDMEKFGITKGTSLGEVLEMGKLRTISGALDSKIYSSDKGSAKDKQQIGRLLDSSKGTDNTAKNALKEVTKDKERMNAVVNNPHYINERNTLALSLAEKTSLTEEAVKKWQTDEHSSGEGLLRLIGSLTPDERKEFFGHEDMADIRKDLEEKGKESPRTIGDAKDHVKDSENHSMWVEQGQDLTQGIANLEQKINDNRDLSDIRMTRDTSGKLSVKETERVADAVLAAVKLVREDATKTKADGHTSIKSTVTGEAQTEALRLFDKIDPKPGSAATSTTTSSTP